MASLRENLLRTLRRQGFDETPVSLDLCPSQVEAFEARFGHRNYLSYFKVPVRFTGAPISQTFQDGRALFKRETLPDNAAINVWGVAHSPQPNCFHMTHMHHPLAGDATLQEVREYPLPILTEDALAAATARTKEIHDSGLAAMAGMACTIWEISWYIRSMEDLMADMVSEDERAVIHLDRITELACRRSRVCAQAGMDIIQYGDDIGMQHSTMMSVDMWRQWLKPRFARVIRAAREVKPDIIVFYHSCGYVTPFLEDLIEIGVDILNPVQPECMDFNEIYQMVGDRMSFWGTIGTQTTLPFGSVEEVRKVVRSRLETCGSKGGIVIAPTHLVEPEVPWENLKAMAEEAWAFKAR